MGNRSGVDLLIYVEDSEGSSTYSVLGGQQASTITVNNELVETTDKLGQEFKEYLEEHGIQSLSLSGNGFIDETATEDRVMAVALAKRGINVVLVLTNGLLAGKRFVGRFMVPSFEITGEHNGAQQYSATFESQGAFTYETA